MFLSLTFAVLLLAVVAVYYLVPRKPRCPGCGAVGEDQPLCSACGWVFDPLDDDDDDETEPEVIEPDWKG